MVSAHSLDEMRGIKAAATVGVLFRTLEGAAAEDDEAGRQGASSYKKNKLKTGKLHRFGYM